MISGAPASPPYGHVCWSFDGAGGFSARARSFLLDGLAAGERVWYLPNGEPGALMVGRTAELLELSSLRVEPPG